MFSALVCGCVFALTAMPPEPPSASANSVVAGIPILITHGDTITKIGDISQDDLERKAHLPPNAAFGYKYSYFGVFWLDFWTWGGEYCEFEGKAFNPITPENCAKGLKTEVNRLPKPFFYRFPLGLVILGGLFGILIPIGMVTSAQEKKEQARIQALFEDSRYKEAFEIFDKHLPNIPEPKPVDPNAEPASDPEAEAARIEAEKLPLENRQQQVEEAIKAAVDYLVQNGEDREIAEKNFHTMLAVLAQANATEAAPTT